MFFKIHFPRFFPPDFVVVDMLYDFEQFVAALRSQHDAAFCAKLHHVDFCSLVSVSCLCLPEEYCSSVCGNKPTTSQVVPSSSCNDHLLFVVTDWADRLLLGVASYNDLRHNPTANGTPWSVHIPLLFQAVKCESALRIAFDDANGATLIIDARGVDPMQWVVSLTTVSGKDRRSAIVAMLGTSLMTLISTVQSDCERERRLRVEAELQLQRRGTDVQPRGYPNQKQEAPEKMKKPQSLLNPGQRVVGNKRGRGVKIGEE